MLGYFIPDIIYEDVYDIDYGALKSKNIKALIFDIDNTLVSYRQEKPTERVIALLDKLKEDFAICFISNNTKHRVDIFNAELCFLAFADAKKPFTKYIGEALDILGIEKEDAALIGDQLFTDVAAAKKAKITAVLVAPIEPVETPFFRFKRFMEKPLIKRYFKMRGGGMD